MRNLFPAATLLAALAAGAYAQTLHQWSDSQGVVNYGPTCPSGVRCSSITPARLASGTTTTTQANGTSTTPPASNSAPVATAPAASTVIWSANMESGTLNDWFVNSGGNEWNDQGADSVASRDVARTGAYSAKLTSSNVGNGTRLWRWAESGVVDSDLVYSVWYYIPQQYSDRTPGAWNNIWQTTSENAAKTRHDPFWILGITSRPDGNMALALAWWHTNFEGPRAGDMRRQSWTSPIVLQPRQWTNVKVRYKCRGDFTGAITVWQDNVQIFDQQNVRTRFPDGGCLWSVNGYADKMQPAPFTIYADDVTISKP